MPIDDKIRENVFSGIHSGNVTTHDLPIDLYEATANDLKKGLYKGYGGTPIDFELGSTDELLVSSMRENIYVFSAAKTYQQVKEMSDALHDGDKLLSRKEFGEKADVIFDQYNKNYLDAEYGTAIATAQNARAWNEIEKTKESLPTLIYHTNEDDQVCEICAPLDGITLDVDNEFWDEFMPPNHFNCGCYTEQNDGGAQVSNPDEVEEKSSSSGDNMDDSFKMNPGKDGVVFKEGDGGHPYFDVEKKDIGFAEDNFGLPIPEKD